MYGTMVIIAVTGQGNGWVRADHVFALGAFALGNFALI